MAVTEDQITFQGLLGPFDDSTLIIQLRHDGALWESRSRRRDYDHLLLPSWADRATRGGGAERQVSWWHQRGPARGDGHLILILTVPRVL